MMFLGRLRMSVGSARHGLLVLLVVAIVLGTLLSWSIKDTAITQKAISKAGLFLKFRNGPTDSLSFSPTRDNMEVTSYPQLQTDVGLRFQKRKETLRNACHLYSDSYSFTKERHRFVKTKAQPPITNVSVLYCAVAKTSSTTWKGILRSIKQEVKSVRRRWKHPEDTVESKEVSFTFVREPYSRLLSAYVDKLFSPNLPFWKAYGRYIVTTFGAKDARNTERVEVTFAEFIKYFIHMEKTGVKRNAHFTAIHEHCDMCGMNYTYIGHLETLTEDMPFILKAIQSPVTYNISFDSKTVVKNAFRDLTPQSLELFSVDRACRRLWKKWQIRGVISKTEPFPLTKNQTDHFNIKDLNRAAVAAVVRSRGDSSLRGQKREALKEAFATVPLEDRLEVQKLMFLDFKMYGFDSEPDEVFPRTPYTPDADFSYFDLYK